MARNTECSVYFRMDTRGEVPRLDVLPNSGKRLVSGRLGFKNATGWVSSPVCRISISPFIGYPNLVAADGGGVNTFKCALHSATK